MGLDENRSIPQRIIIRRSPAGIIENPGAPGSFKTFCTWCCCIFCAFLLFLILISMGAKKDMDLEKVSFRIHEEGNIETHRFPPLKPKNYSRPPIKVPTEGRTLKPTEPRVEPIPSSETCSTNTCENVAGAIKSLIKKHTPACQDFYQHACGNIADYKKYQQKTSVEKFEEKLESAYKEVSKFLENNSDDLVSPSEQNVKKMYQKCLNRGDRDMKDLMKTVKEQFMWPFNEMEEDKQNIKFVNDILTRMIKLNPRALQLFEVVGKDNHLIIRPSFCHGKHEHINAQALQKMFAYISVDPQSKTRVLLEKSLKLAVEVDQVREYCTELSPPTDQKKDFLEDFERSHIDFIRIFQNSFPGDISTGAVLSHLNFTDSHEFFDPQSVLNILLDYHSVGIAHYLVIKYIEDVSKLLLARKKECSMMTFQMMPHAFLSIYENHILHPENSKSSSALVESIRLEYLDMISKTSKLSEYSDVLHDKITSFKEEIGVVGRTFDVIDDDTFYVAFTQLNSHNYDEFVQHVFLRKHDSRSLSFNEKFAPFDHFYQILTKPLYNNEYPSAVQYGRAGHDIATSMAVVLEQEMLLLKMHDDKDCVTSEHSVLSFTFDYLGMRAAWNGFKHSNKKDSVKLPGLENMSDDKLFFYSMVQSTCQPESSENQGHQINSVLKEMKEFGEAFECPESSFMRMSQSCEPVL